VGSTGCTWETYYGVFLFMNTGQIIKSKTTERFTVLPNEVIKSKDLTIEEKGFLAFLLSLPSDWVLYKSNLYKELPDAKGTIDRVFRSLQDKGYILSVRVHDKAGQFVGWNHIVYDCPYQVEPTSTNPEFGESAPILKTNSIQRTDIKQKTEVVPFEDDLSNQAWTDWVKYRKEIRKPLSPSTTESQLNKLRPMAPHTRVGMIRQSIDNGWQGLFEIKENKQKSNGIDYHSELANIYSNLK
jgi:hypothetical protein